MRRQITWDDFAYYLKRNYMPATNVLIVETLVLGLAALVMGPSIGFLFNSVTFSAGDFLAKPWTAATYPLMTVCNPLCLLFAVMGLFFIGGSLERSWGTRVYLWFFFVTSAITAVAMWAGALLSGRDVMVAGLWMPLSAMIVAWATMMPEAEILLYFVLPVKAKYVGWATIAAVLWSYQVWAQPIIAIFALAGCIAAWRYVHLRSGGGRSRTPVIRLRQSRARRLNPLFWLKDYRERKRLRKLFGEDRRDDGDDRGAWR